MISKNVLQVNARKKWQKELAARCQVFYCKIYLFFKNVPVLTLRGSLTSIMRLASNRFIVKNNEAFIRRVNVRYHEACYHEDYCPASRGMPSPGSLFGITRLAIRSFIVQHNEACHIQDHCLASGGMPSSGSLFGITRLAIRSFIVQHNEACHIQDHCLASRGMPSSGSLFGITRLAIRSFIVQQILKLAISKIIV